MNWLKSLWLKTKLPYGRIPQANVLVPMEEQKVDVVVKPKRTPRKKKEVSNDEATINK